MEWYRKVNPVTPNFHAENPGKKPDPPASPCGNLPGIVGMA